MTAILASWFVKCFDAGEHPSYFAEETIICDLCNKRGPPTSGCHLVSSQSARVMHADCYRKFNVLVGSVRTSLDVMYRNRIIAMFATNILIGDVRQIIGQLMLSNDPIEHYRIISIGAPRGQKSINGAQIINQGIETLLGRFIRGSTAL